MYVSVVCKHPSCTFYERQCSSLHISLVFISYVQNNMFCMFLYISDYYGPTLYKCYIPFQFFIRSYMRAKLLS